MEASITILLRKFFELICNNHEKIRNYLIKHNKGGKHCIVHELWVFFNKWVRFAQIELLIKIAQNLKFEPAIINEIRNHLQRHGQLSKSNIYYVPLQWSVIVGIDDSILATGSIIYRYRNYSEPLDLQTSPNNCPFSPS